MNHMNPGSPLDSKRMHEPSLGGFSLVYSPSPLATIEEEKAGKIPTLHSPVSGRTTKFRSNSLNALTVPPPQFKMPQQMQQTISPEEQLVKRLKELNQKSKELAIEYDNTFQKVRSLGAQMVASIDEGNSRMISLVEEYEAFIGTHAAAVAGTAAGGIAAGTTPGGEPHASAHQLGDNTKVAPTTPEVAAPPLIGDSAPIESATKAEQAQTDTPPAVPTAEDNRLASEYYTTLTSSMTGYPTEWANLIKNNREARLHDLIDGTARPPLGFKLDIYWMGHRVKLSSTPNAIYIEGTASEGPFNLPPESTYAIMSNDPIAEWDNKVVYLYLTYQSEQ